MNIGSYKGVKMKCKKCNSENIGVVKRGLHRLICIDCLKLLIKTFNQLRSPHDPNHKNPS